MQTDKTLLANNSQHCWMLHVASVCMLLDVVVQSLKPIKLFSQQLPTFLLFCDGWRVAQQCWISLHSSSNIVAATHAHYTWFTKSYGLYPFHDALQVPTLLGLYVSVCTSLPKCTQQLPNIVGATMFGNCCVHLRVALPALLIDVRHSITIVFKSNAPALLPWYSIAYSPETCSSLIILHQNNIKFYTCANPC